MSTFRLLSAMAVLFATASATIISPGQGASWDVNSQHQIQWDTAGLEAPLQLHLAPGGSSDVTLDLSSSYISTLAPSIPNTGSWTWHPTTSIPQHSSFTIIIIDSGGHHQASEPFQMIGWPEQPVHHTSIVAPVHTTPLYVAPIVHTSIVAPVHTTPLYVAPIVHTSIIAPVHTTSLYVAPIVHTSVAAPVYETPIVETIIEIHPSPSPVIVTSLHIAPIVHTSQPAPIVKTIESPPLVQTEEVAPIVVTQIQEPITKIITQPALVSTEYPAPIVKTVLVTETPSPIIHNVSQPAVTVIETVAPIILTETQAPIVKTVTQAPQIVTEEVAPILVTSEVTETIHLTSFVDVQPVHTIAPVHTSIVVHTPIVVHPASPVLTTLVAIHTPPAIIHATGGAPIIQSEAPIFPNSTAVEIPTFTTPLALGATEPGAAASSGLGPLQGDFTGAAGRMSGISGGLMGGLIAMVMFLV